MLPWKLKQGGNNINYYACLGKDYQLKWSNFKFENIIVLKK